MRYNCIDFSTVILFLKIIKTGVFLFSNFRFILFFFLNAFAEKQRNTYILYRWDRATAPGKLYRRYTAVSSQAFPPPSPSPREIRIWFLPRRRSAFGFAVFQTHHVRTRNKIYGFWSIGVRRRRRQWRQTKRE